MSFSENSVKVDIMGRKKANIFKKDRVMEVELNPEGSQF